MIEVLTAASHLQISTALDLCSDYIISRLTFSNADDFLHVADTYTLNRVIEFYTNKVLTKFPEFTKTEQFLAVSVSDLSRYLRDDKLHVHSERAIYDVVARWFQHDQSRIKSLNDVLLHIRFGLMTDAQLVELTQHWLTTSFPPAMKYINDGRKYHYEVPRGHPTLTTSSQVQYEFSRGHLTLTTSSQVSYEVIPCSLLALRYSMKSQKAISRLPLAVLL